MTTNLTGYRTLNLLILVRQWYSLVDTLPLPFVHVQIPKKDAKKVGGVFVDKLLSQLFFDIVSIFCKII